MLYRLALIVLGPLFFIQGNHVRRVTPELAEPPGARAGTTGQGNTLGLLIVGDSAAAGVGADHQEQALSGQLVLRLSQSHPLQWRLLAESGDASSQLLEKLQALPPKACHVAVVSIGVNDVTSLTRSRVWRQNMLAIVKILTEDFAVQRLYLCGIPPMHLFPALPNPLRWWLGLRAKQLNGIMASVADEQAQSMFVSIPYSGNLNEMAVDGFHPGPKAYAVWGEYVAGIIQKDMAGNN